MGRGGNPESAIGSIGLPTGTHSPINSSVGELGDAGVMIVIEPAAGSSLEEVPLKGCTGMVLSVRGRKSPLSKGKTSTPGGSTGEVMSGAAGSTVAGEITMLRVCREVNVNELAAERTCFSAALCK